MRGTAQPLARAGPGARGSLALESTQSTGGGPITKTRWPGLGNATRPRRALAPLAEPGVCVRANALPFDLVLADRRPLQATQAPQLSGPAAPLYRPLSSTWLVDVPASSPLCSSMALSAELPPGIGGKQQVDRGERSPPFAFFPSFPFRLMDVTSRPCLVDADVCCPAWELSLRLSGRLYSGNVGGPQMHTRVRGIAHPF